MRLRVTGAADGAWMAQVARNLTDAAAGPLTGFGRLIVDRVVGARPRLDSRLLGLAWVTAVVLALYCVVAPFASR